MTVSLKNLASGERTWGSLVFAAGETRIIDPTDYYALSHCECLTQSIIDGEVELTYAGCCADTRECQLRLKFSLGHMGLLIA